MLTSTRKETVIQSTLNHTLKTNPGMLPQSRALEDSSADTPGQARNGADRDAGGQVVRGETGFGRRHRGSASDPESGVSRVFVLDRCGAPLMPCHPARARRLLGKGRAVVVRLHRSNGAITGGAGARPTCAIARSVLTTGAPAESSRPRCNPESTTSRLGRTGCAGARP